MQNQKQDQKLTVKLKTAWGKYFGSKDSDSKDSGLPTPTLDVGELPRPKVLTELPDGHEKRPLRVALAVLTMQERHGWVCQELNAACMYWCNDPRVVPSSGGKFVLISGHNHETSQLARNAIIDSFLGITDLDYLIMVDNDTVPFHPTMGHLVNPIDLASWGLDIVAAPVATMRDTDRIWHVNGYVLHDDRYRTLVPEEHVGTVGIDAVGFGVVCLSRRVLEAVRDRAPRLGRGPQEVIPRDAPDALGHVPDTLPVIMRSRELDGSTAFGEDLLFCRRAQLIGFQSWYAHPAYTCGHYHTTDYGKLPSMQFATKMVQPGPATEEPKSAKAVEDSIRIEDAYTKALVEEFGIPSDIIPKLTGWEMDLPTLRYIWQFIQDYPKDKTLRILELGSGISTLVIALALLKSNHKDCIHAALEHDTHYATKCRRLLLHCADELGVCFIDSAVLYRLLDHASYYDQLPTWPSDLVIIDGPPGKYGTRHLAFSHCTIRSGATVIIDDLHRPNEQQMLEKALEEGTLSDFEYISRRAGRAIFRQAAIH